MPMLTIWRRHLKRKSSCWKTRSRPCGGKAAVLAVLLKSLEMKRAIKRKEAQRDELRMAMFTRRKDIRKEVDDLLDDMERQSEGPAKRGACFHDPLGIAPVTLWVVATWGCCNHLSQSKLTSTCEAMRDRDGMSLPSGTARVG